MNGSYSTARGDAKFHAPVPRSRGFGDQLRVWWREVDKWLLGMVLVLMAFGTVAVAAASPAAGSAAKESKADSTSNSYKSQATEKRKSSPPLETDKDRNPKRIDYLKSSRKTTKANVRTSIELREKP